ncbi:MAG: zinc ribbon domain-containing protein [Bacteroidales bacterium]|nr:zinc ribbon domain-containing protein [Bacteroidales bacterium]
MEENQTIPTPPEAAPEYDPQDIEKNKVMAILAYFGILVLVPIFAAKDSKFAKFHANQGLLVCILGILVGIIYRVLLKVATTLTMISLVGFIGMALWIFVGVLAIIGIVNAAKGQAKELPLIGKIKILK